MAEDRTGVRGMYRVHIVNEDGSLAGDSGWNENQVVNLGFNQYLVKSLGSLAGSMYVASAALGTGAAPAAAGTSLPGEVEVRAAVTAATSSASKTARFTATFASSASFVTKTENISNIGLFASSSGGTLFSGNTYASSAAATNQAVNITYDVIFS